MCEENPPLPDKGASIQVEHAHNKFYCGASFWIKYDPDASAMHTCPKCKRRGFVRMIHDFEHGWVGFMATSAETPTEKAMRLHREAEAKRLARIAKLDTLSGEAYDLEFFFGER